MPEVIQPLVRISQATWEDHKGILRVSKQSSYTEPLSEVRYIQEYYGQGWMLKAVRANEIVGFVCLRHCLRNPYTSIYYLGVADGCKRSGVGRRLAKYVDRASPHQEIRLGIEEMNEEAIMFWTSLGFEKLGEPKTAKTGKRIQGYRKQKTPAG